MLTINRVQYCPRHPQVKLLFAGVSRSLNALRFVCPLCETAQEYPFGMVMPSHNLSMTALVPMQRGVVQRALGMDEQAARLLAEKILREVFRLSQAYGQPMSASFDDLFHDFTLMIQYDDLEGVRLLFHDMQRRSLLEYVYRLENGTVLGTVPHDPLGGVAIVPLTQPFSMNLVISRRGKERFYAAQLRICWSDAPPYTRTGGDRCANPHFAKKTGGRAGSEIYADHHLRRRGRVKAFWPEKHYGFISPDEPGAPEVFFHASVVHGLLRVGDRVSYLPLVTSRGIQAGAVMREG